MVVSLLALLLLLPWTAWAQHEPVHALPDPSKATFRSQGPDYWRNEMPAILTRYLPARWGFVVSGGLHETSGTCIAPSMTLEAFTNNSNRITANGTGGAVTIDYSAPNIGANCGNPGADVCWVIGSAVQTPVLPTTNYARVGSSQLYVDCTSATQPPLPADSVMLGKVTITNGTISAVEPMQRSNPIADGTVYSGHFIAQYGCTDEAIQAAIDSLPVTGGTVYLEPCIYTINQTIAFGNGTVGQASTRKGVVLVGLAEPTHERARASTVLQWAGGFAPVISVNGPLAGWGLRNLYIDGGGTASAGIFVQSGQYGDTQNVAVGNVQGNSIWSTCVPSAPPIPGWSGVTDSLKNQWHNIWVWHLPPANAGTAAVVLDTTDISCNSDFNNFYGLTIFTAGVDGWAIYLGGADHNMFFNTHIGADATTRSEVHYAYNNGIFAGWPCGNNFYGLSLSNRGMTSAGTPLANNTCVNQIFGMSGGDPVDFLPDLPGVSTVSVRRANQNLVLIPGSNTASAEPIGNVEIYATAAHPRNIVPTEDGWANLGTATKRFHDAYLLGGIRHNRRGETVSTTLQLADFYLQLGNNVVPLVVTLPSVVTAAGRDYVVKNTGTQTVTLTPVGGQLINAAATFVLTAGPQVAHILATDSGWEVIGAYP